MHRTNNVWIDTNDEGNAYYRNFTCKLESSSEIPEYLFNAPFGLGTSMFELGKHPEFLNMLRKDKSNVQLVAEQIASALPRNCPRECRIQLCLHYDKDVQALQYDIANSNITLLVTAHDPNCAADTRNAMRQRKAMHDEDGTHYQLKEFADSRTLGTCDEKSRVYRKTVTKNVLNILECSYGITAPDAIMSHDKQSVYDTMNFNQVQLVHDTGDSFVLGIDMNIGSDAYVFHSPQKGGTLFIGTETKWTVPASTGRTLNIATPEALAIVNNEFNLHVDVDEFREEITAGAVSDTNTHSVAKYHDECNNEYMSIDEFEHTYKELEPISFAQYVPNCAHVLNLHAIATALPSSLRQNGMIASILPCVTIQDAIAFTTNQVEYLQIPNTPHWQQELINADKSQRPFHFMNESTAVCSEGETTISHYRIDRNSLLE